MLNFFVRKALTTAVLALAGGIGTAQAVDEVATYALRNVSFADGAVASGGFVFDLSTEVLSSWHINVTGISFVGIPVPAKTFSSAAFGNSVSYVVPGEPTQGFQFFSDVGKSNWLKLVFSGAGLAGAPLNAPFASGTEVVLLPGRGTLATALNPSSLPSAQLTGLVGAVPEPSTLALMFVGVLVIGATIKRRTAI